MTFGLTAALLIAAAPDLCQEVGAERAALERLSQEGVPLADAARALEQRAGAPLAAGLDLSSDGASALADRLESFCAHAAAPDRRATTPADRERLAQILARPEFANARSADGSALARLTEMLAAWLESLFETAGAESFSQLTRVLVLALALAIAIAAALRLARRRSARRTEPPAAGATALELQAPSEHLSRAEASLASNPRLAIREALLALLSALERRSLARPDRVKTNREVASELAERGAAPAVRDEVTALLGWYDGAYYSLDAPATADAQRFLQSVGRMWKTLEAP